MVRFHAAMLSITVCLLGTTAGADTLETVEKKMADVSARVTSLAAIQTTVMEQANDQFKITSRSTGTIEYQRRGKETLMRVETQTSGVTKVADQEIKMDQTTLIIWDGQYAYSMSQIMGRKSVVKMKIPSGQGSLANDLFFKELRKDHSLTILPDEKVDGKDCYVIECVPKPVQRAASGNNEDAQQENIITKTRYWLLKEHGIIVKTVLYEDNNKPLTTMTLSDIKLNGSINPDRFVFTPPEGVEITDMTKN